MAKLKGIQTNKQILSFYTLVYIPNATQRSLPLPFQEQNTHTYVYLQEIPEDDTSHRPYPKEPQNRSEGRPVNPQIRRETTEFIFTFTPAYGSTCMDDH